MARHDHWGFADAGVDDGFKGSSSIALPAAPRSLGCSITEVNTSMQSRSKRSKYRLTPWNPQNILLRYDRFSPDLNSGNEAHMNAKRLSALYRALSFLTASLFL